MMPKPWLCPRRPIGLSSANHSYAHFGLTTDVVREPLSTYTPLKYQSSAPLPSLPCRGSLRTPKCQSAPLLDVLVENGLRQGVAARRVPEADRVGAEVDLVGDVVPHVRLELHLPLALAAHHPLQVGVGSSLLAADPAVFQLREMALEEANLVLVRCTRHIRRTSLNAEMIEHGTLVDRCCGLRDQLRAPHVTVPLGSAVDGDLGSLLGVCVARVFVRRG